jgi:hypothetical protein
MIQIRECFAVAGPEEQRFRPLYSFPVEFPEPPVLEAPEGPGLPGCVVEGCAG